MTFSAASHGGIGGSDSLSDLQRSVLLTVIYADLFDYALTEPELQRRLILRDADRRALRRCVQSLANRYLTISGSYITWMGREQLVDLRSRRAAESRNIWPSARRYASWLSRIPFIRMVAVSGSLAVDNADAHSDVDIFCITEEKRLWLVRIFIVALSKTTRLLPSIFPRYLCPNYILARDALELSDRNLFTAYEVALALPLYGKVSHAEFLRANRWTDTFLPHKPAPAVHEADREPGSSLEFLFAGRLGDRIDHTIFVAFRSFYRHRALRRGWSWDRLAPAYQRNRYTVPEGGYVPVVRRHFLKEVERRLGSSCRDDVRLLFAEAYGGSDSAGSYDWEGQFRRDYGALNRRSEKAQRIHSESRDTSSRAVASG